MLKDWALKSWVLKGWPCQRQMDFKSSSDRQDRSDYDSCSKQITPLRMTWTASSAPQTTLPRRSIACRRMPFRALLPTT